jgi:hypothetical protein
LVCDNCGASVRDDANICVSDEFLECLHAAKEEVCTLKTFENITT